MGVVCAPPGGPKCPPTPCTSTGQLDRQALHIERRHGTARLAQRRLPQHDTAIATCILSTRGPSCCWTNASPTRKGCAYSPRAWRSLVGYLWGLQFPVIKRIWTSTYVLVAGGYSALLLGAFYYVVDMRKWRGWATPFFWIGSNAIVAYVMAGLAPWEWIQRPFVEALAPVLGDSADVLAAALVPCGVIAAMYGLYRKRWYLRV